MENRQRVQAIIIQDKKILFGAGLVNEKEFRHFFIGGGIEEGERPEEAIMRELKEEANVGGIIVFKFSKEYKENHHTFLVDIGNINVTLGYDPEDEEVEKAIDLRALQKLEFIPINEYNRFSLIDIVYFNILLEECNNRNYFPEWFTEMKILVESYIGGNSMIGLSKNSVILYPDSKEWSKLFEEEKMLTNIYLVRHAHSIYTPDELNRPLSEKGAIDAGRITEILLSENIDIVLASPYKRAIQTVEGIARYINTEIIIEDAFKERKIAEGSVDNFDSAIRKLWTNCEFSFEGGESNLEAQKRGIHPLNKMLNKYAQKNIVIGTHGNIMVLMMNYFDSIYDYDFWRNLSMPDVYKLSFKDNVFIGSERIWNEYKNT